MSDAISPIPPVPDGISDAGSALWDQVAGMEGLELRADELAVLETACRVADEVARLEGELDGSPRMIDGSRGQSVLHPIIAELRLQRQLLSSLLFKLNIPEPGDDEPGKWDGLSASERSRKAALIRHNGGR